MFERLQPLDRIIRYYHKGLHAGVDHLWLAMGQKCQSFKCTLIVGSFWTNMCRRASRLLLPCAADTRPLVLFLGVDAVGTWPWMAVEKGYWATNELVAKKVGRQSKCGDEARGAGAF